MTADAHGTVQNGPDIIGHHRTFSDTFSDMLVRYPDMIGHRTDEPDTEPDTYRTSTGHDRTCRTTGQPDTHGSGCSVALPLHTKLGETQSLQQSSADTASAHTVEPSSLQQLSRPGSPQEHSEC